MRIIIGALAALAVSAGAAHAQERRHWEVGWYDVVETEDGCGLFIDFETEGRADTKFLMSIDGSDQVTIGLSSWDWASLKDDEFYEISFFFRGGRLGEEGLTGEAVGYKSPGSAPGLAMRDTGDTFLNYYASANEVIIMKDEAIIAHFNLQGSGAAVARMRSCNQNRQRVLAEIERRERAVDYIERDPFASPPVEDSEE